jgi:hypothetical protein
VRAFHTQHVPRDDPTDLDVGDGVGADRREIDTVVVRAEDVDSVQAEGLLPRIHVV